MRTCCGQDTWLRSSRKGRQIDDERFPSHCNAPDDVPFVFKDSATVGGPEVVFILRRMVEQATEWQITIFVMDCDVAVASDHVSHHVIIEAMEALKVPPVSVAAWINYRGSETFVKLDDVMTQEFVEHVGCHKVTRVQRTCLEQHWTFRQQLFLKGTRQGSGGCPWVRATSGYCLSQTTVGSSRCHQQNSHAWLME